MEIENTVFGDKTGEKLRLFSLFFVMTIVAVSVLGTAMYVLYNHSFSETEKRLSETAKNHARLIESMGKFDKTYGGDYPGGSFAATLSQIKEGLAPVYGSMEITIAKRDARNISFILRQRSFRRHEPSPIPFSSPLAEPMRRALSGKSGTVIGLDYRNVDVLAAHEPITLLDLGIVVKIDISEIRAPFFQAALIAGGISLFIIILGIVIFQLISNPIIKKIQRNQDLLRSIIDNSPSFITLKGMDGHFQLSNQKHLDMFGLEAKDIIGKTNTSYLTEGEVEEANVQHKKVLECKSAITEERQITLKQEIRDFLITKFPVFGPDGVFSIGTIGTDITERKQLERQLQQSQRMEAVGQLTGGVAHDFNNLMAVMIGNAEMLEGKVRGDKEAEKYVEALISAVERGSNLTEHLLGFSRQLTLTPAQADLNHLVLGIENMLSRTLGETIDLNFVPDENLWPVMIDKGQLEHALVNLSLNARDAMPKGGKLTIETLNANLDETYAELNEDVTPGDYVEISVSDTGEGMAPDVVEKVFEPFFTTKEVGKGSGLGLSMVLGFTQQSGGLATISSEVGKGTTVKIYLPRLIGAKKQTAHGKEEPIELPRGTEKILVVEDDESVLETSVVTLKKYGYAVSKARDGKQALQYLKNGQQFDLLFTDVVLPGGLNGVEIAKQAERLQSGIRILYTTGYTENVVVYHEELEEGVTLLKKPYRRKELIQKVRTILDS